MEPHQFVLSWSALVTFLLVTESSIVQALVTCKGIYYVGLSETAEVSCEYPLSFLSVRWYRKDDAPIAFIEGGTKTVSGRYDITVRGELVINDVNLNDEGNYTISVLDNLGGNEKITMEVYVTVALSTKPILESCLSSTNRLCLSIDEFLRKTTLVCTTNDARPPVHLEWYLINQGGYEMVNQTATNITKNETSMTYQSSSILSYDADTFALQSFKCKATGVAVKESLDTSTLVEGHQGTAFVQQNNVSVDVNSDYQLRCSDSLYQVGRWKITYRNGTSLLLPELYPGQSGFTDLCITDGRCVSEDDGSIKINGVGISDEAIYECLYFDGYEAGVTITSVIVVVQPNPPEIVIQGCTASETCEIDAVQNGVLTVSVFDARPAVELTCDTIDEGPAERFLFKDKHQIEGRPGNATFDTTYTVQYDIPECDERVHIVCKVSTTSLHKTLLPVDIYLVTDSLECGESSGYLVLVLVIVILLIGVAAVVVIVLLKRKKGLPFREIPDDKEEAIPLTRKAEFNTLLQQLCDKYETIPNKEFQELLKHGEDFIENSAEDFTKSLCYLFEKEKFSIDKLMELLSDNLRDKQMSQTAFVHITGQLYSSQKLEQQQLLTTVYKLLQQNVLTKEELTHMIMQYSMSYSMDIKIVSSEEEQESLVMVSYPFYLQEIHNLIKKGKDDFKLYLRFEDILKKKVGREGLSLLNKNKTEVDENPYESIDNSDHKKKDGQYIGNEVKQENLYQFVENSQQGKDEQEKDTKNRESHQYEDIEESEAKMVVGKKEQQKDTKNRKSHHYEYIEESEAKMVADQSEEDNDIYETQDDEEEVGSNDGEGNNSQTDQDKSENEHVDENLWEGIKDISVVFVEAVMCSVSDKVMDHKDCETMLQTGVTNKQIQTTDCQEAFKECIRQQWITAETQLQFLGQTFWTDLITVPTCMDKALKLLLKQEVQSEMFIQWQSDCVERKVMPADCLEQCVAGYIQGNELFWFNFIIKLKNANLSESHTDEQEERLFNKVVSETTVKPKKLQKMIKGMTVEKSDKKVLLNYLKLQS